MNQVVLLNMNVNAINQGLRGLFTDITFICTAVLAHTYLNMIITNQEELLIVGERRIKPTHGEMLFPPLAFIPYADEVFRYRAPYPVNRRHPLADWLLRVGPDVYERWPSMFNHIRHQLFFAHDYGSWEAVNSVLERLSELDPLLRPPESAYLKPSDWRDR